MSSSLDQQEFVMEDQHRALVDQEEAYSRSLARMFYVPSDEENSSTTSSIEKLRGKSVSPFPSSSQSLSQSPSHVTGQMSSQNLQRLDIPKIPLHHSRSAPNELSPASSFAKLTTTPPQSPSFNRIEEAFSTWDESPLMINGKKMAAVIKSPEQVLERYQEQEERFFERYLSGVGGELSPGCQSPISGYISPGAMSPAATTTREEGEDPVAGALSILPSPDPQQQQQQQESVSVQTPTTGTDQLGQLVKLMEQLSVLHEQNSELRKKCAYLEDVKTLLRARTLPASGYSTLPASGCILDSPKKAESLITRAQSKVMHYLGTPTSNGTSRRESRATGGSESSAESHRHSLHKRSQSVGSIDLVEMDVMMTPVVKPSGGGGGGQRIGSIDAKSKSLGKTPHNTSPRLHVHAMPGKKHGGKRFSKWMRVKKVFSSKPDSQSKSVDMEGTISAEQLVRSNSKAVSPRLTHMQSVDDGMLSPRENKSDLPPSPSSVQSEPNSFVGNDEDDDYEDYEEYVDIQEHLRTVRGGSGGTAGPGSSSTPSTDGFPTLRSSETKKRKTSKSAETQPQHVSLSDSEQTDVTIPDGKLLTRRRSSPTLGFFRPDDDADTGEFSRGAMARLSRSSSLIETASREKSPAAGKKSAWHKVRDIIHTRTDSLKKTRKQIGRRTLSAGEGGGGGGTDADSEISPDSSSWEGRAPLNTSNMAAVDPLSPLVKAANVAGVVATTAPTPKLMRRYTTKASTTTTMTTGSSRSQSPQLRGSGGGSGRRRRGGSVKGTPDSPATAAAVVVPPSKGLGVSGGGKSNKRESVLTGATPPVDVSALMGGMSDEFNKKMQEWEEKKKHGAFDKEAGGMAAEDMKNQDGSKKFTEDFIKKMEEWERMKSMKGSMSPPKRASMYEVYPGLQRVSVSPGSMSPPKRQPSPGAEMTLPPPQQPQNLSESFSKTVQEWQRVKETRAKTTASPTPLDNSTPHVNTHSSSSSFHTISKPFEHRKSRKEQQTRSKSRDARDKSKQRLDRDKSKQRLEKERQKIEKKEKKIEHEKLKLEQWKKKLDLQEGSGEHGGELSEEFVRKLHEWELMNGMLGSVRRQDSNEKHKRTGSEKLPRESGSGLSGPGRERILSDPSIDKVNKAAILAVPTGGDQTRTVGEDGTEDGQKIDDLERENRRLREEVEEKEEDVAIIQDELEQLTCRFNMMNKEHGEQMENMKRELWASSKLGKHTIESELLSSTLIELHNKVTHLKNYDDQIWAAKEEVEQRALRESEHRNRMENSLLYEIEKLQVALDKKLHRHGPEVLHQLYQYVIGIQAKVYDLRLGVIERNRVIEDLKRHLLVQEVTNKLLVADMQRKDLQLAFYRGCQRGGVIKRWKTFSGSDQMIQASIVAAKSYNATAAARSSSGSPSLPDVPASCRDIDSRLKQLAHGFDDSLNLHFEWLEGLKQQIKEIQEGANKSIQTSNPDMTETESQTVMTLCRASYLPVSDRHTPANEKAVQTSDHEEEELTKLRREQFKESKSVPVKPVRQNKAARLARQKSTGSGSFDSPCSSFDEGSVQQENGGTREDEDRKEGEEKDSTEEVKIRLTEQNRRSSKEVENVSERRKSTGGFITETTTAVTATTESSLDQQEEKAPRVTKTGSSSSLDPPVSSNHPPVSPVIRSKYPRKFKTTDFRMHQLYGDGRTWKATPPRQMMRKQQRGGGGGGKGSATTTSGSEQDEPGGTLSQDAIDTRTHQTHGSRTNSYDVPRFEPMTMRARTRSDGAMLNNRVPQSVTVPAGKDVQLWSVSRLDKPPAAVSDLVIRYEDLPPDGVRRTQDCHLSPQALQQPTVRSPVRRLKTAAELMKDSEVRRQRSRSATRENRERWQPGSLQNSQQDKENNTDLYLQGGGSRVKRLVQQLSGDSTPPSASSMDQNEEDERRRRREIKQLSYQLRSASTSEIPAGNSSSSSQPFNDLTNEKSRVEKIKDSFQRSSSESTPRNTPPKTVTKRHETPKEGTVMSTKEKFLQPVKTTKLDKESKIERRTADSTSTTPAHQKFPDAATAPKSHSTNSAATATSPPPLPSSFTMTLPNVSRSSSSRPRPVSCPRGPGIDPGEEQLVWERHAPPPPRPRPSTPPPSFQSQRKNSDRSGLLGCGTGSSGGGGAITALCMHAASIDLEEDMSQHGGSQYNSQEGFVMRNQATTSSQQQHPPTSAATTTPPGQEKKSKGKGKFLDGNWLPKKFFRVSKC